MQLIFNGVNIVIVSKIFSFFYFNKGLIVLIISGNERQNCFSLHIGNSHIQYILSKIKMTIDFSKTCKSALQSLECVFILTRKKTGFDNMI